MGLGRLLPRRAASPSTLRREEPACLLAPTCRVTVPLIVALAGCKRTRELHDACDRLSLTQILSDIRYLSDKARAPQHQHLSSCRCL